MGAGFNKSDGTQGEPSSGAEGASSSRAELSEATVLAGADRLRSLLVRLAGASWLRWGRWIGLELVLPLLGFIWLMVLHHPKLMLDAEHHFIGPLDFFPGDRAASVWLMWWRHRAWSLGLAPEFSDRICAPWGDTTLANFPNQLESILAIPFMELWGFPAGFTRYTVSVPIFNCMAAWAFFRPMTRWWPLAFLVSFLFGYNAHVLGELQIGRSVTGLVVFFPLVFLCWQRALTARSWPWAVFWGAATGIFGGLSVQQYVPFGLFLVLGTGLLTVMQAIRPEGGARRLLPPAIVAALTLGLAVGVPWFYSAQVYAPKLVEYKLTDGRPLPEQHGIFEAEFWQELSERAIPHKDEHALEAGKQRALERMETRSLPWTWLWYAPGGDNARRAYLPHALVVVLLLAVPLAGLPGLRWGAVALLGWLLTLGPYAAWNVDNTIRWVLVGESRLALPLRALFELIPFLGEAVRPNRAFSLFYLGILAVLTLAVNRSIARLQTRWQAWATHAARLRPLSAWKQRAGEGLIVGLVLGALLLLVQTSVRDVYRKHLDYRLAPYPVVLSPVFAELARDPEDFILLEFPTGVGYAYAIPQAIHGHRRTEGMVMMASHLQALDRPSRCYPHPFQQAMWHFEQAVLRGQQPEPIPAELIQRGARDGFRYLIIYRQSFRNLNFLGLQTRPDALIAAMKAQFGSPWFSDQDVVVFRLEPPAGP